MKPKLNFSKDWKLAILIPACAAALFVPAALFDADLLMGLYLLLVAVAVLVLLTLMIANAAEGNYRLAISLSIAFILIIVFTNLVTLKYGSLHTALRWAAWSSGYKSHVLEQANPRAGELKHIEWDGWGFAGQDTTVFLVYDPADALYAAAQSGKPGKYPGLPCEVYRVRRLESQWYTVQFYTNSYWNYCP